MIVGILAFRVTDRGIERFELLGLEFLVGYHAFTYTIVKHIIKLTNN